MRKKSIIIVIAVIGILLPVSYFAFFPLSDIVKQNLTLSQVSTQLTVPETLEEIKKAGRRALKLIPELLKDIFEGVLGFLQKIWRGFVDLWNFYIKSFLQKEIEKRKPAIEQEFQKQKQEVKEEIKAKLPSSESLWKKLKGLIK